MNKHLQTFLDDDREPRDETLGQRQPGIIIDHSVIIYNMCGFIIHIKTISMKFILS